MGGIEEYLSTRDRKSPLFAEYLGNYDAIANDDLEASIQDPHSLQRAAMHCARLIGGVREKRVCEVGIGQGRLFALLLAQRPGELVGIDIAPTYLQRFADRANVMIANAENIPFERSFDVLVATDILEHVFRPGDFLLSARRALFDGGKLVVRVPLGESLVPYGRLAGCKYDLVHLRGYVPTLLRRELSAAGFKVTGLVRSEHPVGRDRWWLQTLRKRLQPTPPTPWLDAPQSAPVSSSTRQSPQPRHFTRQHGLIARACYRPFTITAVARRR